MTAEFDVSTARGRRAAYAHYVWNDHAYFRLAYLNAHWISDEMVRPAQPWPYPVKAWRDRGIRTIVNLRVGIDAHHVLEQEACDRYGVKQVRFVVTALEAPSREQVLGAKRLFDEIEYPAMMHCKSGADRAGLAAGLFILFEGGTARQALRQLSLRFGHIRQARTGILDAFFHHYAREAEGRKPFLDWVREDYDEAALRRNFHANGLASFINDWVLVHE